MRVAFFVRAFPALSETFILDQVTGLLDRDHEVAVFAWQRPREEPVHGPVAEYGLRDRTVYLDGVDRAGAHLSDLAGLAALGLRAPRALRHLRRGRAERFGGRLGLARRLVRLRRGGSGFDVIHAHFGDIGLRSRFARLLWEVPFLVSFYGADCGRVPRVRGEDVYGPLADGGRAGARGRLAADAVTALSRPMADRLAELGFPPERVLVHHIGVDPSEFPFRERGADLEGRPVRLLTVARLVEKKGVEYAIRAVAALPEEAAVRYEVVGDGPLRPELEALAASLGVADRVRFRGSAERAEVRRALERADLFLLPSVTARDGDQEGTPTVLMEAGACGLPVVSTRHAGIPEVVVDGVTGILVPERDAEALARALGTLLEAPETWGPMGHAARTHIEARYDVRTLVGELEGLYGRLAAAARDGWA